MIYNFMIISLLGTRDTFFWLHAGGWFFYEIYVNSGGPNPLHKHCVHLCSHILRMEVNLTLAGFDLSESEVKNKNQSCGSGSECIFFLFHNERTSLMLGFC